MVVVMTEPAHRKFNSVRGRWYATAIGASLTLVGLTACGPSSGVEQPATSTTSSSATDATASAPATSTPAAAVPTSAQLQAALLTATEAGPGWTTGAPSSNNQNVTTGCAQLDSATLLNGKTGTEQDTQLQSGSGSSTVAVEEGLIAAPAAALQTAYEQASSALAACQKLELPISGTAALDLTLSKGIFPSGANGRQLTGAYSGGGITIPVSGELIVNRVTPTSALLFLYFRLGSGSLEEPLTLFTKATQKATQTLPAS